MLRKKEAYTVITPIPGFIPRQLALDILHSHSEVITLNPLVTSHKAITAPRTASADEFYSTWYEIEERIQYVPGMGKVGSGLITFNGCFHNMPWGLQTHIYAPLNIDLRNRYRIGGNQPGIEGPEHREIGLESLGAPADGLYLREDIEIKCNIAMVSFVKAQLKVASKEMVQRIIKKAELLDAGVLTAMIEDGKLKTINPNDRSYTPARSNTVMSHHGPMYTVGNPNQALASHPPLPGYSPSYPAYAQLAPPTSVSPQPYHTLHDQQYRQHDQQCQRQQQPAHSPPPPIPPKEQMVIMELPGDYPAPQGSPNYQSPQPSPGYAPPALQQQQQQSQNRDR